MLVNRLSLKDELRIRSSGPQSQSGYEANGLLHTLTEIGPHCCLEPLLFVLDMPLCELHLRVCEFLEHLDHTVTNACFERRPACCLPHPVFTRCSMQLGQCLDLLLAHGSIACGCDHVRTLLIDLAGFALLHE